MKTPGAVLLLLWSGLVVVAGVGKGLQDKTAATASTQQTCQPDIYTELREMRALMAEQRVELKELKDSNTDMNNTLKQLTNISEASVVNLSAAEARLSASERTVEEQRAQLKELKDSNTDMNNELKKLQSISEDSKVAFSASFSVLSDKHIGPFNTVTALVFNHVFINIGSAYNPNTGIFTAPVRGVYQFRYHIFAGGANGAGASLNKNGQHVVDAYHHIAPHDITTSQGVSLLLEVGDTVGLRLRRGAWVAAYKSHLTTFSGQLLFLM